MCRQFLSMLLGDGNVGKSANRLATALALCTGRKNFSTARLRAVQGAAADL
jgi:RecA-family ATPase